MASLIVKGRPGVIAMLSIGALIAWDLHATGGEERAQDALKYRGVLRAADGQPIMGAHVIGLELWDAAQAGARLCAVSPQAIEVERGQFSLELSGDCAHAFGRGRGAWADLVVDGERLLPRAQLVSPRPPRNEELERKDGAVTPPANELTEPALQPHRVEPLTPAAASGDGAANFRI